LLAKDNLNRDTGMRKRMPACAAFLRISCNLCGLVRQGHTLSIKVAANILINSEQVKRGCFIQTLVQPSVLNKLHSSHKIFQLIFVKQAPFAAFQTFQGNWSISNAFKTFQLNTAGFKQPTNLVISTGDHNNIH